MRVLRILLCGAFLMLISACATSDPYTVRQTIDREKGQRIDRVCTHKTAYIPWFIFVAAGFFTYTYGEECEDVVRRIDDPTIDQELAKKYKENWKQNEAMP